MLKVSYFRKFNHTAVRALCTVRPSANLSNTTQATSNFIHQHYRAASFFSKFRKTTVTSEKSKDSVLDDESSKLWATAIEDFETKQLAEYRYKETKLTQTEEKVVKKKAFLHAIQVYLQRHGKSRHGFNQYASSALTRLVEYKLVDDLECYKAVIGLFPVGRMQVQTFLQAESGHFSRQQRTMIKILQQMAQYNVIPDDQVGQMIIEVFGWRSHAMQHYRQMMYWLPKLRNANPWPVVDRLQERLDTSPVDLARLIAERLCPDQQTLFELVSLPADDASSSSQPRFLISAQSPQQKALLTYATQCGAKSENAPVTVYLDGPNYAWYRSLQVAYYTLWTELAPSRLEKAKLMVDRRPKEYFHPLPWSLGSHGFSANHGNELPDEVDHTSESANLTISASSQSFKLLPNPVDTLAKVDSGELSESITAISHAEPEFDSRWLALRQSHTPFAFLPNDLTVHEQAQGSVIGLAVVAPMADALDQQKCSYDWLISNKLASFDESNVDSSPAVGAKPSQVPLPAPPQLLRNWLAQVGRSNPSLNETTLVIRAPIGMTSSERPNVGRETDLDSAKQSRDNS